VFAAILRCRTGQLGGVHWACAGCGRSHWVGRSCGNRQASSATLRDVAAATKSLKGTELGFFGVLQTWGRDPMLYHPHVHYLVPGGGAVLDS
jgi:hypothetical protein